MRLFKILSALILIGCSHQGPTTVIGPGNYSMSVFNCQNTIESCYRMAEEDCNGPYYSLGETTTLNGYRLDYTCSKSQFEWIRRVQKEDPTFTPSSVCESSN